MLPTFLVPFLTFVVKLGLASPVYNMQPAYITATIGSTGRNIRNLPCISRKSSQSGVCMFAIDCLKANGTHLGTCIDRFYFGSCCHIEKVNDITENTIDTALIPSREPPSRITATTERATSRITTELPKVSTTEADTTKFQTTKADKTKFQTTKADTTKFVSSKFNTTKKEVVKSTTKFITKKPQIEETTIPYKLQTFQSVDGNDITTILTTKRPSVKPTKIIHKPKPQNTTGLFRPTIKPITRSTLKPRPTRPSLKPSKATRPTAKISVKPVKSTAKPVRITTANGTVTVAKVASKSTTKLVSTFTTSKPSSVTPTLLTSPSLPTSTEALPEFSTSQSVSSQITTQFTPTSFVISSLSPLATLAPQLFSTSHLTSTQSPQAVTTQSETSQSQSVSSQTVLSQSVSSQSVLSQSVPSQTESVLSQSVQTVITSSQSQSVSPETTSTQSTPSISSSLQPPLSPSTTEFVKLPELTTQAPIATTLSTTTTTEAEINDLLNLNASAILEAVNGNLATNEIVEPGKPVEESDVTGFPPLVTWAEVFEKATETSSASSEESEEWMPITTPDGWVLLPSLSTVTEATGNFTTSASSTTSAPTTTSSAATETPAPTSTENPSVETSEATTSEGNATEASNATSIETTTPSIVSSTEANKGGVNMSDFTDVCGRRMFPEARIVGGEKSSFGKWPWQISLRQWRTSTYLHKCGAALLNENWAITAAHCVDNVPPSDLLLRLGEHDLSTESEPYLHQERRVQIVASHPQFDPRTFEYDLALLRFYEPVQFQPNIIPVCVPQNDENFVGRTAYVTGWGRLYEDGPLPSILQEVSVPVINNTVCESMYRSAGYIEHIPNIFICAGWRRGGFDSCEGDSGGPMVIQRQDKRFLLAGVISWGIGCAEPNQPGVYTRISEFRDWINQILQF